MAVSVAKLEISLPSEVGGRVCFFEKKRKEREEDTSCSILFYLKMN